MTPSALLKALATTASALFIAGCEPDAKAANPVEIGTVRWGRDLEVALASSAATGKPVLLLFQEVPGCSGCKEFGREVMSDPGVVKMIEENFVPLMIPNNQPGKDAEILKRFEEPAWNYQVVRFLDAAGEDLIPRKDRVWTKPELTTRMKEALAKAGRSVRTTERVAFSQHCFWTGEKMLGAIPGTIRTEAGFFDGREVTLVDYDPAVTPLPHLIQLAKQAGVADGIYLTTAEQAEAADQGGFTEAKQLDATYRTAPASDQKRQLRGTRFAGLDLTPEQATKINAFARSDVRKAESFLTEKQK